MPTAPSLLEKGRGLQSMTGAPNHFGCYSHSRFRRLDLKGARPQGPGVFTGWARGGSGVRGGAQGRGLAYTKAYTIRG
jgi:hypothetical protein